MSVAPKQGAAAPSQDLELDDLRRWGESLGRSLQSGAVVALSGDLGAGKTTLAQAICRGFGVTDQVNSPTFAIVNRYLSPRGSVHHLDLYRLNSLREVADIGFEEILHDSALVLVEWPECAAPLFPDTTVRIHLEHLPSAPLSRRVTMDAAWK